MVELARWCGWSVFFVPDGLYRKLFGPKRGRPIEDMGDAGFPDLVLCRSGVVAYRELKVGRNALSPQQEVWRDKLLAAGADWAEWRPEQWDAIEAFLNAGRRRG